ncbi:hypothetical protein [Deinococcus maricopensis]|uniref:Uncharacterized protein n=1 Tax=Deinococcus maricopensis (strain DSM 21211 / LMG 22137 / NRRL B-23946 / LB-34) TaxID=709986 RepID=E8U5D9_DEIML|nr:hypothetical protein [Deinococcus maricopensis]ADV66278.1 hypothetical protein Deima_0621 [Deinococcus maricopensis DSM 21211]
MSHVIWSLLLATLTLAAATPNRAIPVTDTPWPRGVAAPRPAPLAPMVDALLTVHLLDRAAFALTAEQVLTVRGVLSSLSRPNLTAAQAGQLTRRLLGALTPEQLATLQADRAALYQRTQAFMARARVAEDGPQDLTVVRYGLMVPGGRAAAQVALQGRTPFGLPEPAALLKRLQQRLTQP